MLAGRMNFNVYDRTIKSRNNWSPRTPPPAWWHRNLPPESPGFQKSAAGWPADWICLHCQSALGRSYSWTGWYSSGCPGTGWVAWPVSCWCKAWLFSPQRSQTLTGQKEKEQNVRAVEMMLFITSWLVVRVSLTDPEVWGDFLHFPHEVSSKVLDIFQIIFHGEGEVHEVVQVNGVVLSTLEFQFESLWFTLKTRKTIVSSKTLVQHKKQWATVVTSRTSPLLQSHRTITFALSWLNVCACGAHKRKKNCLQ